MENRTTRGRDGKQDLFYGWVIAVCCMLAVCAGNLVGTGMSTNLNAMRENLGLSNTQASSILTVRSALQFVAAAFSKHYFDRFGIKKGMLTGLFMGIAACLIFTVSGTNMLLNYMAAVAAGVCIAYGTMLPSTLLLRRWFHRFRGTAVSAASSGTAFVSIVFAPIVQSVVNAHGIKAAFLMQAGAIALVAVIITILVSEDPEERGLRIYGGEETTSGTDTAFAGKTPANAVEKIEKGFSKRMSVCLFAALILIGASAGPSSSNYNNNLVTAGFDNMTVAKCISVYGIVLFFSKLLMGRCVDRIGTFRSTLIFGSSCTAGLLLLALVNRFTTVPFMYVSMLMIGLGAPVQTLGYPNWAADLDPGHYSGTLAKCQTGYYLGSIAGSFIPGILADAYGSYAPAYYLFTVCMGTGIVMVLFIYGVKRKQA